MHPHTVRRSTLAPPVFLAFVGLLLSSPASARAEAVDPAEASTQACEFTHVAEPQSTGGVLFTFSPTGGTASRVELRYTVAGQSFTVPMAMTGAAWQAILVDLEEGSVISYFFAYDIGGAAHQTDYFQITYTAGVGVNPIPEVISRGMWIWTTWNVIRPTNGEASALLTAAKRAQVTDLFLYMAPGDYAAMRSPLRAFIAQARAVGLRVWGLDGDRGYLSDGGGPAPFYKGIDNLLAYNASVSPAERFFGFQSDIEPQDLGDFRTFHNEVRDSALDTRAGTGVWQSSQALDREILMRDWLQIHETAERKLHARGLRFGAAMPSWPDDYYGEEVRVRYPAGGVRQGVMKHMMQFVDDYVVMSYNTNPANAANRVLGEAKYASTLPENARPRVYGGVETMQGVGANVSYGDTPGKQSKAVVLSDLQKITETLKAYPAFHGMNIHDWAGWRALPN
jgi:hypothetical protein